MSLNSVGVLIYGTVIMYILMYWIMWFFKFPYYKKMLINNCDEAKIFCMAYVLIMSSVIACEMGIIYYDGNESPPFTFIGSCIMFGLLVIWFLPEMITSLRNKIPNRWEE